MSKNFELLLLAEQDAALSDPSTTVGPERLWSSPSSATAAIGNLSDIDEYSQEQVSTLVRHLFLAPGGGVHAVALTAVERGNGSSWMTVQCARAMAAQMSGKICVIDANLHNPSLHKYFSVINECGLNDALSQTDINKNMTDFVCPVAFTSNLSLMTCGSVSGMKRGVLPSEAFASLLKELKSSFDYLIIDTPPMSLSSDALVVGKAADGIALVIAEQDTREERARHALQELTQANVRVLGAVLNKRTFPIPQKIYDKL